MSRLTTAGSVASPADQAMGAEQAKATNGQSEYLWAEAALFLLLPVFAAAMARGYDELTP